MKKKSEKSIQEKEAIIAEYLLGETTYRALGQKHGVDFRLVHSWVTKFQGKPVGKQKEKSDKSIKSDVPTDVRQLQEELRKARLHNELLNAMIDIAEDELKISIRKKSGARQ
jgi:transposase-like protein